MAAEGLMIPVLSEARMRVMGARTMRWERFRNWDLKGVWRVSPAGEAIEM